MNVDYNRKKLKQAKNQKWKKHRLKNVYLLWRSWSLVVKAAARKEEEEEKMMFLRLKSVVEAVKEVLSFLRTA